MTENLYLIALKSDKKPRSTPASTRGLKIIPGKEKQSPIKASSGEIIAPSAQDSISICSFGFSVPFSICIITSDIIF